MPIAEQLDSWFVFISPRIQIKNNNNMKILKKMMLWLMNNIIKNISNKNKLTEEDEFIKQELMENKLKIIIL